MKVVAIMQPGYLPWIGFFELMHRADAFVVYDIVKYDKNGWRNRNNIKTANGSLWLTVPVLSSNEPKLNEIKIDNKKNWQKKHLASIENNYRKSIFFQEYYPGVQKILSKEWVYLNELNLEFIKYLAASLEIKTDLIPASSIPKLTEMEKLDKVDRLIAICKYFSADHFYEPAGGKNYLEPAKEKFGLNGIKLVFQNIIPKPYQQLFGNFLPNLSALDLLFNVGPTGKNNIIESGENVKI